MESGRKWGHNTRKYQNNENRRMGMERIYVCRNITSRCCLLTFGFESIHCCSSASAFFWCRLLLWFHCEEHFAGLSLLVERCFWVGFMRRHFCPLNDESAKQKDDYDLGMFRANLSCCAFPPGSRWMSRLTFACGSTKPYTMFTR